MAHSRWRLLRSLVHPSSNGTVLPLLAHRVVAGFVLVFLLVSPSLVDETSAMATSKQGRNLAVRVVSYNVLSSHLARPDHFTRSNVADLDFETRVPRVLDKIDSEINAAASSPEGPPVVFCLQEVSHMWASRIHAFFANRNYHMLCGLYGKRFNNYMGVALAYPTDAYETEFLDISRLSDYRVGGWPRREEEELGLVRRAGKAGAAAVVGALQGLILNPARRLLRLPEPKSPLDHWEMSENRQNILLTACLRRKSRGEVPDAAEDEEEGSGGTFVISNYHMPCAFYAPMVMNIHAEMAARRCQDLAKGRPHILAGDFNLMPDSPHYKLLTTGKLDWNDSTFPSPKYGMVWTSNIAPMRSAYAISDHGEPDFTNYAQVR